MRTVVYLDNNATTAVDPRVLAAMLPYFGDRYGNAASLQHAFGQEAAAAVQDARSQVAALINADPQEIVFTSGATESDNLAIKGLAAASPGKRHILSAPTEHHAVLDSLRTLARAGYDIEFVPVDADGLVDLDGLRRMIRGDTLLVTIMAANNEIGTLSDVASIGAIVRERGALFHCDGAQLVGTLPVDVRSCHIDLLSISGHKMYGPKGIGCLYVRRGTPLIPIIDGGGHERGLRSGTVNVPACVGLGAACDVAASTMVEQAKRVEGLRDSLYRSLCDACGTELKINGHPNLRLPGNLNLHFPGVDADNLMLMVPEVAVSSGSACSSASPEPSHVLQAIGLSYTQASQCIRLGLGRFNTGAEVEFAADRLANGVSELLSFAAAL